jgi:hypothetical protein
VTGYRPAAVLQRDTRTLAKHRYYSAVEYSGAGSLTAMLKQQSDFLTGPLIGEQSMVCRTFIQPEGV